MKLIGYTRVSTQEQAHKGISLEAQAHDLCLYCELHRHELVEIVSDEGVSGSTLERPGLQYVIACIATGRADGLLVTKIDRLSRKLLDLTRLTQEELADGALISVQEKFDTSTAAGRLIFNVLATVAQWERESTIERIRVAMAQLKRNGVHLGRAPYGFDLASERGPDGYFPLVPNALEQDVLCFIVTSRAADPPLSFAAIAERLNADEIPTKYGAAQWTRQAVARIHSRITQDTASP